MMGWHYPQPTKFAVVADSQRFEFLCTPINYGGKESKADNQKCIQSDSLTKDDPSDADYYESLFMDIPFQTFAAIGNAKTVQVQIGTATFRLRVNAFDGRLLAIPLVKVMSDITMQPLKWPASET